MASRGYDSSSLLGKPAQAPGMMRHGPFPGRAPSRAHLADHVSHAEVLERKIAAQEVEIDKLTVENQRLAATHVMLRQELAASQHELQRIHAHVKTLHNESDIQIRGFLDKIMKAEAEIFSTEEVEKELKKAHMEAQSLLTERQELTAEIQHMAEGLHKANADIKKLPEFHGELERLRQEHQKLRSAFEYEKNLNREQVEQMCGMEKNLITMSKEAEKLRAEILKVERAAAAQVSHQHGSTYGAAAPPTSYSSAGQVFAYHPDQAYPQGPNYAENAAFPNAGYIHGSHFQGYGSATQMAGGANHHPNGGLQAGNGTNKASGIILTGPYDTTGGGVPPLPPGPAPPSVGWR